MATSRASSCRQDGATSSAPENGDWCLYRLQHGFRPPLCDGVVITNLATFNTADPTPPVAAYMCGRDGVGITLAGPDGPLRWVLLDGYDYHIDDEDEPGCWLVREMSPHAAQDWDEAGGLA